MTTENDNLQDLVEWHTLPSMKASLSAGEVLRAFRQCDGLTLKAVAIKAGISYQLLGAYERGEKLPSIEQACRLALALGLHEQGLLRALLTDQLKRAGLTYGVELKAG
jgi:transcriptional regulator with XRE-family HTH domain